LFPGGGGLKGGRVVGRTTRSVALRGLMDKSVRTAEFCQSGGSEPNRRERFLSPAKAGPESGVSKFLVLELCGSARLHSGESLTAILHRTHLHERSYAHDPTPIRARLVLLMSTNCALATTASFKAEIVGSCRGWACFHSPSSNASSPCKAAFTRMKQDLTDNHHFTRPSVVLVGRSFSIERPSLFGGFLGPQARSSPTQAAPD